MHGLSPEMVLGKEVVDAQGDRLGAVVDVGVHDWRRVKFLLVENAAGANEGRSREERFRRLSVDLIDSVDSRVVLKTLQA